MWETNGIPPRLNGRTCEELICQQYWYNGKLTKSVDILYIKTNGRWHLLYFENSTIFWRSQDNAPCPFEAKEGDPFKYPFVDLGMSYGVKGDTFADCVIESLPDGARVVISLEQAGRIILSCVDNQTSIQHIRE